MSRESWREKSSSRTLPAVVISVLISLPIISFFGYIGAAPPIFGDWIITGEESYSNTTILLNGSLIIAETGKLNLENVTLIINSTYDGQYRIQVNQNGVLIVNNSWIKPYDPNLTFEFKVYGNLFFNYSTAENLYGSSFGITKGGIQVYGGNLTLHHSRVRKSIGDGIHLIQGNATLSDCEVSNNGGQELYLYRSHYVNVTSCRFLDNTLEMGLGVLVDNSNNFSIQDSESIGHSGFGLRVMNSQGFMMNNSYVAGTAHTGGVFLTYSNNSIISNSTVDDNTGGGISVEGSRDVLLYSNVVSGSGAYGIDIRYSNATIINNTVRDSGGDGIYLDYSNATIINNTVRDSSGAFYLDHSTATFIGNIEYNNSGGGDLTSRFSNITSLEDSFGTLESSNSTITAVGLTTVEIPRAESSNIYLINSTMYYPPTILWGTHITLLNTSVLSWEYFSVDRVWYNPSNPSRITVKNFLNLHIQNETGNPLPNTDILIEDNGIDVYRTPSFGGTDPPSNMNGESNWIVLTDRIYHKDYQTPGHPFKNITYNTTSVYLSRSGYKFNSNPRIVEMNTSHTEIFKAVPPSPPHNLTAVLTGNNNENVTLRWNTSIDDGNQSHGVSSYHIFRGTRYDRSGDSYQLITSLSNGTTQFTDVGKGDGDPRNYFYIICASNRNLSSCTSNQAGKFSKNLSAGIQLISIPLIQEDWNEVFKTLKYDKMWSYLNGNENPWKSFHMDKKINELSTVDHSMGIWINLTADCNLTLAGIVPIETRIPLHPGWNLVGFPSFKYYSVQDLINETGAIRIEGYDFSSPYFLREVQADEFLSAGEAYWIEITNERVWKVSNV